MLMVKLVDGNMREREEREMEEKRMNEGQPKHLQKERDVEDLWKKGKVKLSCEGGGDHGKNV